MICYEKGFFFNCVKENFWGTSLFFEMNKKILNHFAFFNQVAQTIGAILMF
jgi:hypothetical protein